MIKIKSFPNKHAVGTFSPFDQIIRLNGFTSENIRHNLSGTLNERWKKSFLMFRTLFHEYTHFLDMTTTTYGLSVTSSIFSGATGFSTGKESSSHLGASIARKALSELQADEMHGEVTGSYRKTWGYREWYGNARSYEGDISHILTGTVFLNPENNKEFAKAPFSIPSLMESNAMANEIFLCANYVRSKIPGEDEKNTLMAEINSEILELIYHEGFSTYSVCFHRCANSTGNTDIIDASRLSALICDICLNVAPNTLANIAPPPEVIAHVRADLRETIINEIKAGSRPLLFFMLTSLLKDAKYRIKDHAELRIELEEKSGLRNFKEDERSAKEGLFKILSKRKNTNPQYGNLLAIIEKNISIEKKIPLYNFYDYELPAVLLRGGQILDLNMQFHPGKVASNFDPSEHAEWMADYVKWL